MPKAIELYVYQHLLLAYFSTQAGVARTVDIVLL